MKKIIIFAMLVSAAVFFIQHHVSMARAAETGPVHSITLPTIPPHLKDGPGKDKVMTWCAICHTPDYIPMQPLLPAKTWEGEVHKMIKVFGAPIPDADAKTIISYLVSQYGNGK